MSLDFHLGKVLVDTLPKVCPLYQCTVASTAESSGIDYQIKCCICLVFTGNFVPCPKCLPEYEYPFGDEIRFSVCYDIVQWKYMCLNHQDRGSYEHHSNMPLVWKGMIDWFDKNIALHEVADTVTKPDDGRFHVDLEEFKVLWKVLYHVPEKCISLCWRKTFERNTKILLPVP